jgi:hypothetical protein
MPNFNFKVSLANGLYYTYLGSNNTDPVFIAGSVKRWLDEHDIKFSIRKEFVQLHPDICFEKEEDAILFKLTWL